MNSGEKIKALRLARNLTQQEFAEMVGYKTASAINKIEMGKRMLKKPQIIAFATALGVSPAEIVSDFDEVLTPLINEIPVFDGIAAGAPLLADDQIIGYMPTTVSYPKNCFALIVHGTSMINAGIPDGCKVVVQKQETAENGQIVACRIGSDEVTLKRYRASGNTILLMPENPAFEPIIVPEKDFVNGDAAIIGIVKQIVIDI